MADQDKKTGRRSLENVEGDMADLLNKTMSTYVSHYVKVGPGGTVMPGHYEEWFEKYDNFPIKEDDIWVVTYPKAGTTWTQELVWSIMFDMDSEEAKLEVMKRFPFFELDCLISGITDIPDMPEDSLMKPGNTWKILQNMKTSPRTIKSHFPLDLLPNGLPRVKPKIIYVMRDPRDVCVSYYYHSLKFEEYSGTFDEFVRLFLADLMTYSPTWPHMLEFWQKRHEDNILLLRYEEMKEDLAAIVRRVAKFLEKSLTEEEVARITEHCTFDTMKNNEAANQETMSMPTKDGEEIKFMRKGIVGDWKNHLSEEQEKAFKEWTMMNVKGTDFPFYQDYD